MPSKSKSKFTLAQHLSGIQQIILSEVRAAQNLLNQAVEAGDYTAIQNMLEQFQRIMEMRKLSEKLLELARIDKASASGPSAPPVTSQPSAAAAARTKTTSKSPTKKSSAKKVQSKKTNTTTAATKTVSSKKAAPPPVTVPANGAPPPPSVVTTSGEASSSEAAPVPTKRRGPTPSGLRTPERAFVLPILQTLAEKGGQADAAAVVEGVLERMQHQLKPSDFETTATSDQPRWKVSLYLARSTMMRQGLLRSDTPRGIWAISEQGERYLTEHAS